MTTLHFMYRMEIDHTETVSRCYFTIKCIPREDERQHLEKIRLWLKPHPGGAGYSQGRDSFGNRQIYGCVTEPHRKFVFRAEGEVEILQTGYVERVGGKGTGAGQAEKIGIFRYPHGKCVPGEGLESYHRSLGLMMPEHAGGGSGLAISGHAGGGSGLVIPGHVDGSPDLASPVCACPDAGHSLWGDPDAAFQVCTDLMHRLHQDFSYVPGATQVRTTAEEAWGLRKGVCQDYAHIYITLLRMSGIPARYVCGLIAGEGASHAWVEALCGDRWIAFDPTNDCLAGDQYIKLGHGRDADDHGINRGIMWGGGLQTQKIWAQVEAVPADP